MADPDQGPIYVFADSHQSIYRSDWEPPFDAVPFELTTNCRNTHPISTLVASVFDDAVLDRGADGPEPISVAVQSDEGVVAAVRRLLHKWLNEGGLDIGQVAVLSQRREIVDRLRGAELAGHRLTALGGGGVTCETIHRFKGLEADAVILILDSLESERDLMLAYVGLSRAKSVLAVVAEMDELEHLQMAVGS
jgi:superfamily I DNA/RNA helicase